jgi:hypothetical protein
MKQLTTIMFDYQIGNDKLSLVLSWSSIAVDKSSIPDRQGALITGRNRGTAASKQPRCCNLVNVQEETTMEIEIQK